VGLAWHFWNTRWRHRAGGGLRGWERAAILAPLLFHAWLLYDGIFAASELRFGFAQALSVMTWLAVLAYWSESLLYNLDGMEPLVLLAAAATVTLPAFFPGLTLSGALSGSVEFRLHLALAMAAYGLFVIALLHALLMLAVERGLHAKKAGFAGNLPPLLTLENLLFRAIGAAFVLLTLTLVTGIAFS
jgi:ABC-type uncharacterized transport system permease subunit